MGLACCKEYIPRCRLPSGEVIVTALVIARGLFGQGECRPGYYLLDGVQGCNRARHGGGESCRQHFQCHLVWWPSAPVSQHGGNFPWVGSLATWPLALQRLAVWFVVGPDLATVAPATCCCQYDPISGPLRWGGVRCHGSAM